MQKYLFVLATSLIGYYFLKTKNKKSQQSFQNSSVNQLQKINTIAANPQENRVANELTDNDIFTLSGEYRWTFYLGPIKQVSTHIFAADYIDYRMQGKAHHTNYRIHKISYDAKQQKWIGKTDDGLVYVLFFKEHTNNQTLTLYKHKCAYGEKGLKEAIEFIYPDKDTFDDHGWNIYSKKGCSEPIDILPFSGEFIANTAENNRDKNADEPKVSVSDKQITLSDKTYKKLSHHMGEHRWVGQCGEQYLVMFYKILEDIPMTLSLSLETYQDIEKAYQSKHAEQQYTVYQIVMEN